MASRPREISSEAEALGYLYGLAPAEFVPARNELVKAIRASGDKELANQVKGLRKPSMLAAELNRVLRVDAEALDTLLETALALRDGHRSVLSGELVDLAALQATHRRSATAIAELAEHHQDELNGLLEATSLDASCHDDLRAAAYVAAPTPTVGFDLFAALPASPTTRSAKPKTATPSAPATTDDEGATATVSSLSEARDRKAQRLADERIAAEAAKAEAAEARIKKAEAALAKAAAEHDKADAALKLAYRQVEAKVKRQTKATARVADAEQHLAEARHHAEECGEAVTAAQGMADKAEERLSATADALRLAQQKLGEESPVLSRQEDD